MSGIARFTANNIANGILRAVVFRPYQGVFSLITIVQFYGTRVNVISFVPVKKKIYETHKRSTLHAYLLHRFQLNRANVENTGTNSFTPNGKALFLLHLFSPSRSTFLWTSPVPNVTQVGQTTIPQNLIYALK